MRKPIINRTPAFLRCYGESYLVYGRLWKIIGQRNLWKGSGDWSERGTLISPRGDAWRLCGMGDAGGPRLLKSTPKGDTFRDVNYCTLLRARLLGWRIVNDSEAIEPRKYTISRWQDGTHFYVRDDEGNDVTEGKSVKWDTWDDADRAGKRYVARNLKNKA